MNGTIKTLETYAGDEDHLLWRICGTGDFSMDGKADYVLRNQNAGVFIRFMDGTTPISPMRRLGGASLSVWDVVGCGDLNMDGAADVLFRRKADGSVYAWLVNGGPAPSVAGIVRLGSASVTGWDLCAGTGDFDGNGVTDILWRKIPSPYRPYVWLMNADFTVGDQQYIQAPAYPNPDWSLVGAGDYTGDGMSDLLWRNQSTGDNLLWKMDGIVKDSEIPLEGKPGSNWEIVGPK
jgi:hypothetical protein